MAVPEFTTEELESEEWRDVVGYEGVYSVSNFGRVRRELTCAGNPRQTPLIMKPSLEQSYYRITLWRQCKPKHFGVHQLVAAAFLSPRAQEQTEINHIDTDKLNNRPSNLEYCTRGENATHAARFGLLSKGERHGALVKAKTPRGERNHAAKLTEKQVLDIRARFTGEKGEQRRLAREFGVDKTLIALIVKRRIWTHI